MKKEAQKNFAIAISFLAAFALWTLAIRFVDVQPIGPQESSVGFAILNGWIHRLTGVHMSLYVITDWLGLIPLGFVFGFGILGLVQWIQRKKLHLVDFSILVLGGFYLIVMAVFLLFEVYVVNYRPVLIEGILEVSYPSSTTLLVMCVMPTTIMQLNERLKNGIFKKCLIGVIVLFTIFMVAGRIISGVHWITDIIGGALLSTGLVTLYKAVIDLKKN